MSKRTSTLDRAVFQKIVPRRINSITVHVRLPTSLKCAIKKVAADDGCGEAAWIRWALEVMVRDTTDKLIVSRAYFGKP